MKRKKVVALFKAVESISRRPRNEVYVQKSDMKYKFESGATSEPIVILPTKGKYMLPEVKTIKDIITSIEPVDVIKESVAINRLAGFPLVVVMASNDSKVLVLNVNTVYGAVSFMVNIDPGEELKIPEMDEDEPMTEYSTEPVTDKELAILKKYAQSSLH